MLVLSRKIGEKVVFPQHEVLLTVLDVRGERVRLGIVAPPNVRVFRHEVWERIHRELNCEDPESAVPKIFELELPVSQE